MSAKTDNIKLEALKQVSERLGCRYITDEPMSKHTTFKIGGECDIMVFPNSNESLCEILSACKVSDIRHMVIGNGSNVLFSDCGYRGAVIVLGSDYSDIYIEGEVITASAGAPLLKVCRKALDAGLTGLEFAYGIPGSVGGAVYMNAGAYGGEIRDVVKDVTCIIDNGEIKVYSLEKLDFGYRSSVFARTGGIVSSVRLKLEKGEREAIKSKMEDLMSRRKARQPLEYPSAGSTFKRPKGTYSGLVIEQSGLKGYSVGGAKVSDKHANFVINAGGATASDVTSLIAHIKKTVLEKTGYELECEVELIDEA